MIRLEHPLPADDDGDDELARYRVAAATYRDWMRDGVLVEGCAAVALRA